MRGVSAEQIARVKQSSMWDFGNQVLYEMCNKAPAHNNQYEIMGKVWLIGRSYAAAIERGAKTEYGTDDFYRYQVADTMKQYGAELDARIWSLARHPAVTKDILGELVGTHKFLTDVFYRITGKSNRSLASKYLHFHVPDVFYIYDSRAYEGVTKLKTLDNRLKKEMATSKGDSAYVDFIAKVYPLNVMIYEEYGEWLTPRQMDALLLDY